MRSLIKFLFLLLFSICFSCVQKKSTQVEKLNPKADINEFEMEVNNGGFNQYFFNSGQNCFETLKALKKNGKTQTAKLLENAISLINPNHLSEKEFIEKLQKREVEELNDEKIIAELLKLDSLFYKYPDGNLTKE